MEMRMAIDGDSVSVLIACPECRSTGLYRGFAEPEGVAVICLQCRGHGGRWITFHPFTGRKLRDEVTTVAVSQGTFIGLGVGPDQTKPKMSYDEFLAIAPTEPPRPPA